MGRRRSEVTGIGMDNHIEINWEDLLTSSFFVSNSEREIAKKLFK